jgi:hypothetical protein
MAAPFDSQAADLAHVVGPSEERENPSTGADRLSAEAGKSGCALQSFLDASPRHDVVAVAETEGCLEGALLVPQLLEARVETLELGGQSRVVTL